MYEGYDFLTAFRSLDRAPNDSRTHYRGMRVQRRFDLGRINIISEANDQFFGSADDEKISVFEPGKIAGVEPSFWIDCRSRIFRRAMVTF